MTQKQSPMNSSSAPPQAISGQLPRRIVIIGSNESAWMAAACLGRLASQLEWRLAVITHGAPQAEFPGEASQPSLRGLLGNLQINEHSMMRQSQATYHLATQFSDWAQIEHDFWKPLAPPERTARVALFDAWFAERSAGRLLRPFQSYSLHWGAALAGKGPCGFSAESAILQSGSYAFHLDGHDFASSLRTIALAAGVEEIAGEIADVASNRRGGIAQIQLTSGLVVEGDFFIDSTGNHSATMHLTTPGSFQSWNDTLLCDRMVTMRLPGRRQIPPFTRISGLAAGWLWQFPLATSIEVGYSFASNFATDETALHQMREALKNNGLAIPIDAAPEFGSFRVGRHSHFWRDNLLKLGSTACVPDPLLSAGRHLCQLGIETFIELLPECTANAAAVEYYNERMTAATEEIRDFAQLHYLLSRRTDAPFWQAATSTPVSESLRHRLELYATCGRLGMLAPEAFSESSYQYLLAGCGRLPNQPTAYSQAANPALIQESLRRLLEFNETALKDLALHEDLLDWIHN